MLSPVRKMFDGIAHRYDFLNHFLSLGRDIAWRKSCSKMVADLCRDQGRIELLDLCGGTGDFAGTFCRYNKNCATPVVGDFSFGMLNEVARKGIKARVVQLDAMKMPFAEGRFDVIVNGFGMRNLPDAKLGLMESFRVLKQGGYICFLEFFSPRGVFNRFFYKGLAPLFIPLMGAFFSGKKDAYEYLVNSIVRFLPVKEFSVLAESVGFEVVRVKEFDLGISYGVILRKR